ARLERTSGAERVSMGGLLEEGTRNSADAHFFVFDGRGHTYAAAGVRVDNVVRGLLSIGVRPGERVGVLMDTRPSALTAITALNRIGAVAVMLRPDGATSREAQLGDVRRIIADPEHADAARAARRVSVYALGGGGAPRDVGPGITDLERITPALVQIPNWYVPNPGKASDLAFVLFTGEGATTRAHPVTNGQWARSAYGTATAARLSTADTVYSVTPLHHAAGLLTSVGGALAGGSRLALTTSYDPDTFWAEVRRYGVTVVSYTWTLLGDLIEADRAPGERHHPVRLFVGSGMPAWLWQRTLDRFPTAAVLEFFVSSSEDVVLANLSGRKVGAKGRPIPASAEVAVVKCDLATGEVRRDYDALAHACGTDEVGLLIARTSTSTPGALRNVLAAEDAWASTGHVFRRDVDGDHWLVGAITDLVHTAGGVVPPAAVEDALGELDSIELVAAYGVRANADSDEQLHAALSLRPGRQLDAAAVTKALSGLSALQQPAVVRVLPQIPVTTWWRPLRAALRADAEKKALVTWVRASDGSYAEPGRSRRLRRPG
ncbi:AMP-binding protein, partial [Sporichthya sp.]|uniref:AMP-binding protein n=1 Tax=Sporichthya sp. TaxID=65475 RepID=UPI0017B3D379